MTPYMKTSKNTWSDNSADRRWTSILLAFCVLLCDWSHCHAAMASKQDRDYRALTHRGEALPVDPNVQEGLRRLWSDHSPGADQLAKLVAILYPADGKNGPVRRGDKLATH